MCNDIIIFIFGLIRPILTHDEVLISAQEYENSMQEMARSIKQMNTMGMPDL